MYIKSPRIRFEEEGDRKVAKVDKIVAAFNEDDFNVALILESLGKKDALDEALESEDDDAGTKNWLEDLD